MQPIRRGGISLSNVKAGSTVGALVTKPWASPILNLTGSMLGTFKNGVEEVAKLSDGHKKKSCVFAIVLGWLGIDPSAMHTIGSIFNKVGGWFMAF